MTKPYEVHIHTCELRCMKNMFVTSPNIMTACITSLSTHKMVMTLPKEPKWDWIWNIITLVTPTHQFKSFEHGHANKKDML